MIKLSHNHDGNPVKEGDMVIITAVFNKNLAVSPLLTISNTDIKQASMRNDNGDQRTWSYSWTVPGGNGTAVATVVGKDASGNVSEGKDNLVMTLDNMAPSVNNLSPANNGVRVDTAFMPAITFTEKVVAGTGNITIYKSADNSVVESIAANSALAMGSSTNVVNIKPATVLDEGTSYYIQIDPGAFKDGAGNEFAGIKGRNVWSFTTLSTAPTITFLKPANRATVSAAKGYTVKVKIALNGFRIDLNNILLQMDGDNWLNPVSQSGNLQECNVVYQLPELPNDGKPHQLTLKVDVLKGNSVSKTITFQTRVSQEKKDSPQDAG